MYIKKLVIAVGTGRCCSKSFQTLMNLQRGVEFYHEFARMPWEMDRALFDRYVDVFTFYDGCEVVGDFGSWYIRYVDRLYGIFGKKLRVIYLWRDHDQVVESYMKKVVNGNHWTDPEGEFWTGSERASVFDQCYPKYDLPKRAAIRKYCEDYHTLAMELIKGYPNFSRIFYPKLFSDRETQERLFDFIGIPEGDRHYCTNIHTNKGYNLKAFMEGRVG